MKRSLSLTLMLMIGIVSLALFSGTVMGAGPATSTESGKSDEGSGDDSSLLALPYVDLRPVILDVTKDQDASFELFISNPIVNEINIVGDILFRVPPGMTIYSSMNCGGGSSGNIKCPFVNDPMMPGGEKTISVWVRSQRVGTHEIKAIVTLWPEGKKKERQEYNPVFPFEVKEASSLSGRPSALEEKTEQPTPEPQKQPAPAVSTKVSTADTSSSCSLGGSADGSLMFIGLLLPAIGYLGWRRKAK